MIEYKLSSGNLVADKRAHYAQHCAATKDFDVAIDMMRQALELAPHWASGWYGLGQYFEKTNDLSRAQDAYGQALLLSKTDYLGAGLKIAYLAQTTLNHVPVAYTEALFDGYAERFDTSLVKNLDYVAPTRLAALLKATTDVHKFAIAIDLGCGTGLMAEQVSDQIDHFIGVDLSASMLAKAKSKQLYGILIKADMVEALPQFSHVDLVIAADVFMYCANLAPVFNLVSICLETNGLFLFCVENYDGDEPWMLRNSMRHAHAASYIEALLHLNNLTVLAQEVGSIRSDGGKPIAGLFYLAQKQTKRETHAA